MQLADVVKSLRLHWRAGISILLIAGLGFALFIITRKQVQPAKRYRVDVQLLVPAIDKNKGRPAGVPPTLLQGQNFRALSPNTENAALDHAQVLSKDRHLVDFAFAINDTQDIITLSVTTSNAVLTNSVARAFAAAYLATRQETVASGASSALAKDENALQTLKTSIAETETQMNAIDPNLLKVVKTAETPTKDSPNPSAVDALPDGTPNTTTLLVVRREALLSQVRSVQSDYAQNVVIALIPQPFGQIVQVNSPLQITPKLPSPLVPAAAFLGIGLILALAVPVLMDRLDKAIRSPRMAGAAFDTTVLASIPPTSRRLRRALTVTGTPPDDAYRALAATSVATDRLPQAIVVMSPTGVVQDTVAANFAAALAELGLRVALVATDPRQSWFLDTRPGDGGASNHTADPVLSFPELLDLAHRGRLNGALPRGLVKTHLTNLLVMPPGEELRDFNLDGLRPLLEALSSGGVDITVIAGPSLLEDPRATILAWTTRSVLWACETGEVTEAEAREAAARLTLAGATSFGVAIVNGKT